MVYKKDIIEKIRDETGMRLVDIETVVNLFLSYIDHSLTNGENVKLTGFGTFELVERKARKGAKVITGEQIIIPAKITPVFRYSKKLLEAATRLL